ncbi:MAG: hypothetical protein ABL936_02760 [Aestuariivirga sp.]
MAKRAVAKTQPKAQPQQKEAALQEHKPPPDYFEPGDFVNLVKNEQTILREAGHPYSGDWTGIAFPGGGARAATFCLGAMQAFALREILPKFDYMSTVSGGGYIGTSLQWFLRKTPDDSGRERYIHGTSEKDFPFGTMHPDPAIDLGSANQEQQRTMQFLRDNISYLAPGGGITLQSGVLAVIRTVFLNLIVWVPLVSFLFLVMLWLSFILANRLSWLPSPIPGIPIYTEGYFWLERPALGLPLVFAFFLWLVWIYLAIMALVAFATSFVAREKRTDGAKRLTYYLGLSALIIPGVWLLFIEGTFSNLDLGAAILMTGVGTIATVLALVFLKRHGTAPAMQLSYYLRRGFETKFAKYSDLAIFLAILGVLPLIYYFLRGEAQAGNYGVAGLVFGVGTALYGHYSSIKSLVPGIAGKILIIVGSLLFLLSFMVVCFALASYAMGEAAQLPLTDDIEVQFAETAKFLGVLIAVLLSALVSMYFPNINQIGLHRYYRDRLMETFMPGPEGLKNGSSVSSPDADKFEVVQLAKQPLAQNEPRRPFPIINTNVILVNDESRKTSVRGGSSFAITPLYSGSHETGWIRTSIYAEGQGPIQLASAMAVSGAAANSNAGYTGVGITRNRLVSMVMLLLNVRLGLWLTNPRTLYSDYREATSRTAKLARLFRKWLFLRRPRHMHPGATYGLLGRGYDRKSQFVELSDGGHFENLGLYELARRRASVIVICDGEADKELSYAGLISAARRIEEDFYAIIDFHEGGGPERLVPKIDLGYPSNSKAARAPYLVAQIRYRDSDAGKTVKTGVIVYVKATMVADLSFVSRGYRGKNPDFPHQSTVDQFFQAEQFEAYRELGYRSALRCIDELKLLANFGDPEKIWRQYLRQVKLDEAKA